MTTITLSKTLTAITAISKNQTNVSSHKIGEFTSLISPLSEVNITGTTKPAKLEKFVNLLNQNGFSESVEIYKYNAGFEGKNSDVITFNIKFKKSETNG